MKYVYFVRHGESEGNAQAMRGHDTHALTEKGRAQAESIAGRCKKLPIECLVSSTTLRAAQTADVIGEKIGHLPLHSDLFVETRAPSRIHNLPRESPEVVSVQDELLENFHISGWRHSDEENFEDLKLRAEAALTLLADRPEEHILVVTHGRFMRVLMAYLLFGRDLTAEQCRQCLRALHMENTGLTVFGYDERHSTHPWWLWTWNDHAHLG